MKKLSRIMAREISMKYVYGIDVNKLWDEDHSVIDASTESFEMYADDIDEFDTVEDEAGDVDAEETEAKAVDVETVDTEVAEDSSLDESEDENILYINKVVSGIVENKDEIDRLIEENSRTWKISRFSKIDLAILRVAVFEIIYINKIYKDKSKDEKELLFDFIPYQVAINEAVRVAKKYGTKESSKFVNGILGGIVRTQGIA